jgi:signal transduction histidine kinase
MSAKRPFKLQRIRLLMFLSFSLLIAFSAHWLISQYDREKNHLQKDLTKLFSNVQEDISDSLLWMKVVGPTVHTRDSCVEPGAGYNGIMAYRDSEISAQGARMLLKNVKKLSKEEEKQLFRTDTIVFNDIFTQNMRAQGMNFTSKWVHADKKPAGEDDIFIMSNFFTNEHGIIISNYESYLTRKMYSPAIFILFLLVITGIAFRTTYLGLRKQMTLATLKDDFINNMSHELKTPVATVKVALEALANFNAMQDPQRRKEYLEMAIIEMNRLELLVNRALSTSLLESGKLSLHKEECDLQQLTEEVMLGMQPKLLQHDAKVVLETSGNSFLSNLDKMHTQGVIINLIDNSIKYGVNPVEIKIRLTEQDNCIQLSVTDNGPGIPEEYSERVFDKFFRVPTGNKHNAKGYGLGLSYAAQVMQQHMGSIRVANMPEGGCRFTLTF